MSCWWSTMSALFSTILHIKHHSSTHNLSLCGPNTWHFHTDPDHWTGSCSFLQWLSGCQQKVFSSQLFLLTVVLLTILRSHKTVEIKVFLKFLLVDGRIKVFLKFLLVDGRIRIQKAQKRTEGDEWPNSYSASCYGEFLASNPDTWKLNNQWMGVGVTHGVNAKKVPYGTQQKLAR